MSRPGRAALGQASTRDQPWPVWPSVVVELSWVLRGAKWERARVLRTLDSLLRTRGVTPEAPQIVRKAVEATKKGGEGGFADHLIAQVGLANGCREAITFDAGLGKAEKVRRLP